jgi:hypothetical protein
MIFPIERRMRNNCIVRMVDAIDGFGGTVSAILLTLVIWATSGYLAHLQGTSHIDRISAGFFLAAYAMGASSIVRNIWLWYRNGGTLQNLINNNGLDLVIWGFAGAVLLFAGFVAWYVGWNGKTGTDYGVGVFAATFVYDWSVGRYLKLNRRCVTP